MLYFLKRKNLLFYRKVISAALVVVFGFSLILVPVTPSGAQGLPNLPAVGQTIGLTSVYQPPVLRGMTVHPENPLLFDFIVDRGQDKIDHAALKNESTKLIKYFFASMTIPDKDAWVNLSPYEQNRIIPDALGQTEMGRQMLEQDYMLKQLSASLTNPEKDLGQKFWNEVRTRAQKQFGTSDIPLSTFNKVWIVPDGATVVEKDGFAYITESKLKVMLDEDYVALANQKDSAESFARERNPAAQPHDQNAKVSELSSVVFREMILPKLVKEVNTGKNFAQTRQVYQSVILAAWYKKALKDSLLGRIYADKSKVEGVESDVKDIKQKVYQQYLEAFKKGAYNIIKEDASANGDDPIPRKYFSGGITYFGETSVNIDRAASSVTRAVAQITNNSIAGNLVLVAASGAETRAEINFRKNSLSVSSSLEEIRFKMEELRSRFAMRVEFPPEIDALLKEPDALQRLLHVRYLKDNAWMMQRVYLNGYVNLAGDFYVDQLEIVKIEDGPAGAENQAVQSSSTMFGETAEMTKPTASTTVSDEGPAASSGVDVSPSSLSKWKAGLSALATSLVMSGTLITDVMAHQLGMTAWGPNAVQLLNITISRGDTWEKIISRSWGRDSFRLLTDGKKQEILQASWSIFKNENLKLTNDVLTPGGKFNFQHTKDYLDLMRLMQFPDSISEVSVRMGDKTISTYFIVNPPASVSIANSFDLNNQLQNPLAFILGADGIVFDIRQTYDIASIIFDLTRGPEIGPEDPRGQFLRELFRGMTFDDILQFLISSFLHHEMTHSFWYQGLLNQPIAMTSYSQFIELVQKYSNSGGVIHEVVAFLGQIALSSKPKFSASNLLGNTFLMPDKVGGGEKYWHASNIVMNIVDQELGTDMTKQRDPVQAAEILKSIDDAQLKSAARKAVMKIMKEPLPEEGSILVDLPAIHRAIDLYNRKLLEKPEQLELIKEDSQEPVSSSAINIENPNQNSNQGKGINTTSSSSSGAILVRSESVRIADKKGIHGRTAVSLEKLRKENPQFEIMLSFKNGGFLRVVKIEGLMSTMFLQIPQTNVTVIIKLSEKYELTPELQQKAGEVLKEVRSILMTDISGSDHSASSSLGDLDQQQYGGIDFDTSKLNLQIKRDEQGVPLPLPQQNLENIDIKGLYPVIINILPINAQTLPILSQLTIQPKTVLSKG